MLYRKSIGSSPEVGYICDTFQISVFVSTIFAKSFFTKILFEIKQLVIVISHAKSLPPSGEVTTLWFSSALCIENITSFVVTTLFILVCQVE